MPKKKDNQTETSEEENKPSSWVLPQKFYRDEQGRYWENNVLGGKNFLVPAPIWAGNINPYLFEGPTIFIMSQRKPLCDVPMMRAGGKVADGGKVTGKGNLILTDEEKNELLKTDPLAEKFIRPYMMGKDFINNIKRWCLWLKDAEPAEVRKCPRVLERIEKVREFRLSSKKPATRKKADTPMLFDEPVECKTDYLAVPSISSSRRRYIPIAWLSHDVIPGANMRFIDNASLYIFGVLMSSVHMAWTRVIGGRLKSDYSYGNTVNYNAFVWPNITDTSEIERTAQAILDARAKYPRSSLADLYDERTMPPELRKAHNENDEAVMNAYGFKRHYEYEKFHEEDIVIRLMYMYKELTGCEEFSRNYPNREFWESLYGNYEDAEDED
ncbi:MAG: hypothetical protein IJU48_01800 [Synergistaceae bacterium]|nr:hypothetical protein [Synergistaceae bacterium]